MTQQVFVARKRELAQLNSFLDRVLAGQGQVAFVTGEAGAGKTALVTEFARRAQRDRADVVVAVGDCNAQSGIGDPYLPFRHVLEMLTGNVEAGLDRDAVSQDNAQRLREFLRVSGQALVDFGPDLIDIFVPGSGLVTRAGTLLAGRVGWLDRLEELTEQRQAGHQGTELEQARIFEQYAKVLQALAREQPIVIVLDDLQWADEASISLLFHLGRSVLDSRILILGAYRPDEVALGRRPSTGAGRAERHPLEKVLAEFKRYLGDVWIDLQHAKELQGRDFIDAFLDSEPNRLGEDFRAALYGRTSGHPLFTVELLRHLQERGELVRDADGKWIEGPSLNWDALPVRVEGVIEERIGRLDENLREILTVAAVEGEDFTAEVVAQVRTTDAREVVRRLSGELEKRHRLVGAQGFQQLGSRRFSLYRFRHNVFQMYLYNRLDEIERAYLHEDVGQVLEDLYAGQPDRIAAIAGELAWHFEAAGLAEKALTYLSLAGERAQALYAPHEAVAYFTHALEVADLLSVSPVASLYRARGHAHETLGDFERARADYTAALEAAEATDDHQAAWQALVDLGLLWASRDYAQAGAYYEQALQRARALDDAAMLAHTLNRIGNWYLNVDQPGDALGYHEEALAAFQRLEDQRGIGETLDLLALASAFAGDLVQAARYGERAAALFRELGDRRGLASCLTKLMPSSSDYTTGTLIPAATSWAESVRSGEQSLEIARTINWPAGEARAQSALTLTLGPRGEYARALYYARASLETAQNIAHHEWMTGAYCTLGALYLDLLDLPEAQQQLEQAVGLAKEVGSRPWMRIATGFLASTYVLQNELRLAETALDSVLEPDTPFQPLPQRLCWCARGELALAVGEPGLALEIADRLIATAANLTPEGVIPLLWRLRGAALAALNRAEEAEVVLQAAQETARALSLRPMLWRLHGALGGLYGATARPDEAEVEFQAARTIIEELAANVPDEALRENFLLHANATLRHRTELG